jgi:LysR family transcriptional regulator, chromosome initiation inhibitor
MSPFDPAALECLAALADGGSFERAAQLLSITQSAVSQRLRALESSVGRLLVVRSRPLRLTEPGKVLLRHARQMQALRADIARELGTVLGADERLPIAVNADSLATWVLPALDSIAQAGQREGFGLELVVDDQDFTHDGLREGLVLGCVSTVPQALRGCSVQPLGAMRYIAVASPGFIQNTLPQGLHQGNFAHVPFIVFNRKDDMQAQWVAQAFGVAEPRLQQRFVPGSEAGANAAAMGWGIGVLPELLAEPLLQQGRLRALKPDVHVDVALHWHQWRLGGEPTDERPRTPAAPGGVGPLHTGVLDRVGQALADGAKRVLRTATGLPAR